MWVTVNWRRGMSEVRNYRGWLPSSCISRLWSKKMSKKREQMSIVFCYPANNQVTFYLENLLKNPKKSKNLLWNEKKSYCTFQSLLNIQGLEMLFLFQMNIILSNPILLLCTRSLLALKCPFHYACFMLGNPFLF